MEYQHSNSSYSCQQKMECQHSNSSYNWSTEDGMSPFQQQLQLVNRRWSVNIPTAVTVGQQKMECHHSNSSYSWSTEDGVSTFQQQLQLVNRRWNVNIPTAVTVGQQKMECQHSNSSYSCQQKMECQHSNSSYNWSTEDGMSPFHQQLQLVNRRWNVNIPTAVTVVNRRWSVNQRFSKAAGNSNHVVSHVYIVLSPNTTTISYYSL